LVVFVGALLTWGVLILKAMGDPDGEPYALANVRTIALVVAFVVGSIALPSGQR
jgi:hypothetical protein